MSGRRAGRPTYPPLSAIRTSAGVVVVADQDQRSPLMATGSGGRGTIRA